MISEQLLIVDMPLLAFQGRVWLVSLSTQAVASTNSSLFITSSAGKPLQDLVFKVSKRV